MKTTPTALGVSSFNQQEEGLVEILEFLPFSALIEAELDFNALLVKPTHDIGVLPPHLIKINTLTLAKKVRQGLGRYCLHLLDVRLFRQIVFEVRV